MKGFDLTTEQLRQVVAAYKERIVEGLANSDREIAALPTYLGLPDGSEKGKALVVDTGGTNMRAALVELSPSDGALLAGPVAARVPDGRDGVALAGSTFFAAQADLAAGLEGLKADHSLPLGYCFSYPAKNNPGGDAVLLRWTKGLCIDGVVGKAVGAELQNALKEKGVETAGLTVLNDTVASLLGGVHLYGKPTYGHNYIGLILGTGSNMAGVFTHKDLTKVNCDKPMVVNLESGNFNCPLLTPFDDELDAESNNVGAQRFEKAVSGHYLPQLFDKAHPGLNLGTDSGKLVDLRDNGSGEAAELAGVILRRSARLVAAGLAAVAELYPADKDTAVLGEGGLLWGDAKYAPTVEETLKELLPQRKIELVRQRENVNLLGAAAAALGAVEKV